MGWQESLGLHVEPVNLDWQKVPGLFCICLDKKTLYVCHLLFPTLGFFVTDVPPHLVLFVTLFATLGFKCISVTVDCSDALGVHTVLHASVLQRLASEAGGLGSHLSTRQAFVGGCAGPCVVLHRRVRM